MAPVVSGLKESEKIMSTDEKAVKQDSLPFPPGASPAARCRNPSTARALNRAGFPPDAPNIQRTKIRATKKLPTGKVKIKVETAYAVPKPAGPLNITMKVNGEVFATFQVPISAPLLFTANDCLDIGIALGSPVSLDYCDKAPFKFNGTIEQVHVEYVTAKQKPAIQEGRAEETKKEPVAAT
jgi:hypothetical protein